MSDDVEIGDEWPEAPDEAVYHHKEHWWGWRGHGWVVSACPPLQGFSQHGPFPRALFGPPGTRWIFTVGDVVGRLSDQGGTVSSIELNAALKWLGAFPVASEIQGWTTPGYPQQPEAPAMAFRWLRCTVVATLGTTEQVAHVLNFRHATAPDADMDAAAVLAFGNQVRDKWAAMWGGGTTTLAGQTTGQLVYTDVRTAYLQQDAPASITTHPGRRGLVKDFHYPRPAYIVPTQYSTFTVNAVKGTGAGNSLPWEVACALTFTTGLRGPRFRGRLYLGPFVTGVMDTGGLFGGLQDNFPGNFVNLFLTPLTAATQQKLVVLSRAYADARFVTGVSVGKVPDSQRRRRKHQPELRSTPVVVP